jgi:NAD(P)-dependent dehydrogenase (short-subunit alcohol dehydrogenase family)
MTMGLVDGKVALVTGAAGGIGGASAKLFAAEGAKVMVVDIDGEGAEEVAAAIRKDGGEAVGRRVDVADEAAVEAMVAAVVDLWGRVDCAHNNAGISDRKSGMTQLALADWHRMIDVNLTSVFLCLKHELRQMVDQGGGAIVNTSSGAGIVGYPPLPHYVAAKHGVLGLTKCAAQEFVRQGIRVNAVLPGLIETPMLRDSMATEELAEALRASVPRGTLGQPEEVAQAVVWLCSDRASFVSGESMLVDGASVCR